MRGVFRFSVPEKTELTLAVTATLKEWQEIQIQLQAMSPSSAPDIMARQVRAMIEMAEKSLAQASWTTGYATGEEEA